MKVGILRPLTEEQKAAFPEEWSYFKYDLPFPISKERALTFIQNNQLEIVIVDHTAHLNTFCKLITIIFFLYGNRFIALFKDKPNFFNPKGGADLS